MAQIACGIDIGGSALKGALVNLETGEFVGEQARIETPYPATPEAIADTCGKILEILGVGAETAVGIAMPAPLPGGVVPFMANLDDKWEGVHAPSMYEKRLGRPVTVMNDADAAGLAEVIYGAAKGHKGAVIITTLGTGIGSALVYRETLFPNTELGHLEIGGVDAETEASAAQKTQQNLDWDEWSERLQKYYSYLEMLFSPELFVVGGGVSAEHEKFLPLLDLRTPIIPAQLRNTAGIVGAAYQANIDQELAK